LATLVISLAWLTNCTYNCVTLAKAILLDLTERNVDVVWPREVSTGANESIVVEHVQDAGNGD
jgi:hypothetical protein